MNPDPQLWKKHFNITVASKAETRSHGAWTEKKKGTLTRDLTTGRWGLVLAAGWWWCWVAGLTSHTMGVRDITGAWAVAAATAAALLWSLLDTPPSWDKIAVSEKKFF
jgi:hypothetical protein